MKKLKCCEYGTRGHYAGLERLAIAKQSILLGQLASYEEKEGLWICLALGTNPIKPL
jgi:hypothetical protein